MSYNTDTNLAYNTYSGIKSYAYKVIALLFPNDTLWKLIKYNSRDVLNPSVANLTASEKVGLIWTGELADGEIEYDKYRVFQQASTDNVFLDRTTQMRVYVDGVYPDNAIMGTVDIKIEILTHSNLNGLTDTQVTRLSIMLEEILKTLNGSYIDGIGNLYFNADATRRNNAKYAINNGQNYLGYIIVMSTKTSKISSTSC